MGRKVNPIGFRLILNHNWESKWFAERGYTEQLHQDLQIRRAIMGTLKQPSDVRVRRAIVRSLKGTADTRGRDVRARGNRGNRGGGGGSAQGGGDSWGLANAGVARIDIERAANKLDVTIHTAKPGIVIGKAGANVDRLKGIIERVVGGDKDKNKKVHLRIEEIKQPELNARLVAESIAEQIGRRVAYRRAAKQAVLRANQRGAKGIRIHLSGRLGGAEMSRPYTEMNGRVPLHTMRANIDYGIVHAHTTYGRIGVKVWIYKGDVLPERTQPPLRQAPRETPTVAD